ncbi:thiamine phosphate synthase [Terrilactibacillus laevilacticus]|uniref:Thiamine phosphate synthase n=1 Tax=Terrilactibacillus laevilacticus TaxID=1380157 RepID=A0ABW5PTH2_9BACI|nr:thiamine phosphate synthase [Terrilactibacillus laevilacticus]
MELHVLTTGTQSLNHVVQHIRYLVPYFDYFHIREKHRPKEELSKWIETFLEAGIPANKIIMNNHIDLALAYQLGGVQLPESIHIPPTLKQEAPHLKVGSSVHSAMQAQVKMDQGADYLLYGHVFETSCKPGLPARGLSEFKKLTQLARVPVIAIGGINPSNISMIRETGGAGIAVMSGILGAPSPLDQCKIYYQTCKGEIYETKIR